MKVIYEFDSYEDRKQLKRFKNALEHAGCIEDISNHLRRTMKHGELSEDAYKAYENILNFLHSYEN